MPNLPLVIDSKTLHSHVIDNDQTIRILDIRDLSDYQEVHIPEAVWFDRNAVNRREGSTNGLLPDAQTLFDALKQSGYQQHEHLVIYNDSCTPEVGRVAWTLYVFGIQQISILDGGFNAWLQQSLASSNTAVENTDSHFDINQLTAPDKSLFCNREAIQQSMQDSNTIILDTRSAAEFHGEDVRSTYGGHIPGSININWTEIKQPDGILFKSKAELEALFSQQGIDKKHHIITYCQTHQRSALVAIVLMHLGYQYTAGYPGAWSDWGNREDTSKAL